MNRKKGLTEILLEHQGDELAHLINNNLQGHLGLLTIEVKNPKVKAIIHTEYHNLVKSFYHSESDLLSAMDKAYNCMLNIDFTTYQWGAKKK